jgi:hypothetical protein
MRMSNKATIRALLILFALVPSAAAQVMGATLCLEYEKSSRNRFRHDK